MQILEGSKAFMNDLESEALSAKERFYVQVMTFEGDSAGEQLISLMLRSSARKKCLLIDCYSKAVINDTFVFSIRYLKDPEFRKEVTNTRRLVKRAESNGIEVVFTNPLGFLGWRYPLRNHKKIVVVDNISYLGGINFSDHNFSWHDMMVKLDYEKLSTTLVRDIHSTIKQKNQSIVELIDKNKLYLLNGSRSQEVYEEFFRNFRQAKSSIIIISPYVSNPMLSVLRDLSKEVEITIFTPEDNNKGIFKKALLSANTDNRFKIIQLPGMTHMKAILIDDEQFFFGSSNYDLISYYFEQEVVFQMMDSTLINQFKGILERLLDSGSLVTDSSSKSPVIVKYLEWFCKIASRTIIRPQ